MNLDAASTTSTNNRWDAAWPRAWVRVVGHVYGAGRGGRAGAPSGATLHLPRQQGPPSAMALRPEGEVQMDMIESTDNIHPGPARSIALDPNDDDIMEMADSSTCAHSSRVEARGNIQTRVRPRARENLRRHARLDALGPRRRRAEDSSGRVSSACAPWGGDGDDDSNGLADRVTMHGAPLLLSDPGGSSGFSYGRNGGRDGPFDDGGGLVAVSGGRGGVVGSGMAVPTLRI